jgi:hypothetical protein
MLLKISPDGNRSRRPAKRSSLRDAGHSGKQCGRVSGVRCQVSGGRGQGSGYRVPSFSWQVALGPRLTATQSEVAALEFVLGGGSVSNLTAGSAFWSVLRVEFRHGNALPAVRLPATAPPRAMPVAAIALWVAVKRGPRVRLLHWSLSLVAALSATSRRGARLASRTAMRAPETRSPPRGRRHAPGRGRRGSRQPRSGSRLNEDPE